MRHFISGGFAFLVASSVASGQGVLLYDVFDLDTYDQVLDFNNNFFGVQNNIGIANTGQAFNQATSATLIYPGHSGLAKADQASGYTPANPGINGNFGVHTAVNNTSAQIFAYANEQAEFAVATSFGYVEFSVSQPTQWSIAGNVWGTTQSAPSGVSEAQYYIRLWDFFNNVAIIWDTGYALNGNGDYNINFSHGGTLAPGWYGYDYFTWSQHGGNAFSPGFVGGTSSGMTTTLTLVIPAPAASLPLAFFLVPRRRRR